MPLKVCFSCIELFGLGIYGGFGRATRFIGRELVKHGVEVTIVSPERKGDGHAPSEMDGMQIRRFNPYTPWAALEIYKSCDADIYHSQDTWLGTWLAMKAVPQKAHVITFRDPHDKSDWRIETGLSGADRLGWWAYRTSIDDPLVRPEDFFELARQFPDVDFIAVGGSRDQQRDGSLRSIAAAIPNVRLTGVIDQFQSDELQQVLSMSWILVNASPREGLPNAFLEGAANRCAILSYSDPDGFASSFGYHASPDDLAKGLELLLADGTWKAAGERGHEYINRTF